VPDWELVYEAHYRRLVVLLAAVTGSVPEAEEAVQEAFARALSPLRSRRTIDDPVAWLYGVALNVARSRWRRASLAHRHSRRAVPAAVEAFEGGVESRVSLLAALRTLPSAQRESLALHYLADLSIQDIAARLGVPEGTVKARLSRGRDALGTFFAVISETERKTDDG
jgi:RNA polymerase sigma factor (sigma-70 family)